jgi:hypothetical protein
MSNTNTGGPAFPFEYHNQTSRHQPGFFGTGDISPGASQQFAGMTLRDYFAAKALQGFVSSGGVYDGEFDAKRAYAFADEMLKAREA